MNDATVIIDAIESGIARLETTDGRHFTLSTAYLPEDIAEGDALTAGISRDTMSSTVVFTKAPEARADRRRAVRAKLDRLRGRGAC